MKIYEILVSVFVILLLSITNSYAFNSSIEGRYDFNSDKVIDGFDWKEMSMFDKFELISSYHDNSFKTVTIDNSLKEKEIIRIIKILDYYYKGADSENKKIAVWDTYELIFE